MYICNIFFKVLFKKNRAHEFESKKDIWKGWRKEWKGGTNVSQNIKNYY